MTDEKPPLSMKEAVFVLNETYRPFSAGSKIHAERESIFAATLEN